MIAAVETLTAAEGDALALLEALLGLGRVPQRASALLEGARPELLRVGTGRVGIAARRLLVEAGGARERTVLRDGRRATGRVWDAALNGGFALRFTGATTRLWLEAAKTLPVLDARAEADGGEGKRRNRRLLRDMVDVQGLGTGDQFFYALVHRALPALRLQPEDRDAFGRKLRQGSALARAIAPFDDAEEETARGLAPWMAMPDVRLLECTEDLWVRAWRDFARETWEARPSIGVAIARWRALGSGLRGYVAAADRAGRMDLTRAVLRFLRGLFTETFAEGGDAVRKRVSGNAQLRDLRERDEYLAQLARVVEVGALLLRRRDELAGERYGDDRYEEAQLFLRIVADEFAPARRALEDLTRALSTTIG